MGVIKRLFKIYQLVGVEVRCPNAKDWNGTEDFEYCRDSVIIDEGDNIKIDGILTVMHSFVGTAPTSLPLTLLMRKTCASRPVHPSRARIIQ